MKKQVFALLISLFCCTAAFSTWSIIIIDPKTKEIGIVAASCSGNCYGIGRVVPNVGGIIVQAWSNNKARAKGVELMIANATPEQIIAAMKDPMYKPEHQQYAVVTLKDFDKPATFTGDSCYSFNGTLTAPGVSVQGNTLGGDKALQLALEAVLKGQKEGLPIAEILLNALEAGSRGGGDKRCGEQTANTAFIIVAKPDDKSPYLDLRIVDEPKGGQNAVQLLRKKYEGWKQQLKKA